jgi:hypothetical protein
MQREIAQHCLRAFLERTNMRIIVGVWRWPAGARSLLEPAQADANSLRGKVLHLAVVFMAAAALADFGYVQVAQGPDAR